MNSMRCVIMLAFVMVCSCKTTRAQCSLYYSLSYATYVTHSYDGTYLYTSVLTDGSAAMGINPGCPDSVRTQMQNAIDTGTHQASSLNYLGTVGGWQSTAPLCIYCYISDQNNQHIVAATNTTYTFNSGGQVYCTAGGNVYSTFSSVGISLKLSAYIFNGLSTGRCTWIQTCTGKCSSPHTTSTFGGVCWTNGPWKQCFDITINGNCWDYRSFCYTKTGPGICTN
jgi:hypothetical protein